MVFVTVAATANAGVFTRQTHAWPLIAHLTIVTVTVLEIARTPEGATAAPPF